jgi:hypothetical protein
VTAPRLAPLLIAASLALPTGCGSDDGSGAEAAKLAVEASDPSKGKIALEAPESVKAGAVEITLTNSGKGPHGAQLVRVEGDHTADEVVEKVLETPEGAPTPEWAFAAGGVAPVPPGKSGTATVTLEPGSYYIADDAGGEEQANAGNGGITAFEVTGEGGGELPKTDATIVASEYTFETSGLRAGKNRLTFENSGKELHHAIAFPLREGATVADLKELFASDKPPAGPPPFDEKKIVGTSVLEGGLSQVADIEFESGTYALVCFISDRKGGPPHVAKGMISELKVE